MLKSPVADDDRSIPDQHVAGVIELDGNAIARVRQKRLHILAVFFLQIVPWKRRVISYDFPPFKYLLSKSFAH